MCKTLPSKKSHSFPGNSHASNSNVTFDAGLISLGTKEPSSEQQGMFEMPAFSNRDFRSSSLSVSTSFSIRTDDSLH